jgi:propanol-preferring alcohol dehydrogenase
MKAMMLENSEGQLTLQNVQKPAPSSSQVLIKVHCCGVCRTDLHILDGDLNQPNLPLIPGHQIIGTVEEIGPEVRGFNPGDKVGVPWLGETCGRCEFCRNDRENLCDHVKFTGYDLNGGFAEYTTADSQYCFSIPEGYAAQQAAPLLCAGLIGYRSLRKTDGAPKIGFYGYGSSAHILTQLAVYQNREVFAFTRPGDSKGQQFALDMGAVWASASNEPPPQKLDAAIIFAPAGPLIPEALKNIKKGGIVVCAGIHMSDIPKFSYDLLWGERVIKSVANLTRQDGEEFLKLAPKIPITTSVTTYPLEEANEALNDLREGNFEGSAVLKIS